MKDFPVASPILSPFFCCETSRDPPEEHVNRDREGEMAASAERRRKALMTESGEVRRVFLWDCGVNNKKLLIYEAYINVYMYISYIHVYMIYVYVYIYISTAVYVYIHIYIYVMNLRVIHICIDR